MVTLKKSHFSGKGAGLGPNHVSNGHWAIRHEEIRNRALFANRDTTETIIPDVATVSMTFEDAAKVEETDIAWTTTAYIYADSDNRSGRKSNGYCRILNNGRGDIALIRCDYLDIIDQDHAGHVFYSDPTGTKAFRTHQDIVDATALIMPITTSHMPPSPWAIPEPEPNADAEEAVA